MPAWPVAEVQLACPAGTLSLQELHEKPLADGGSISKGPSELEQLFADRAGGIGVADERPVNHELLGFRARPFHKADRDPRMRA